MPTHASKATRAARAREMKAAAQRAAESAGPVAAKPRATAPTATAARPAAAAGPRLIDISPRVTSAIANWPGDVPYQMAKSAEVHRDGIDIGSMHTSFHVGSHTDAHCHYVAGAEDAATMPLGHYFGPCQVMDVRARRGKRYGLRDLAEEPTEPRVLLRTGTYPDPDRWTEDFAAPEPALIDDLAARGVVLVGLDTPSTDLFASKGLEAHKRLHANGMANLEGLVLGHVEPGHYTLVALPLRLAGADASPVRAVLAPPARALA